MGIIHILLLFFISSHGRDGAVPVQAESILRSYLRHTPSSRRLIYYTYMMAQVQMYKMSTEGIYVSADPTCTKRLSRTRTVSYTISATDNCGRHETDNDDGPAAAYNARHPKQVWYYNAHSILQYKYYRHYPIIRKVRFYYLFYIYFLTPENHCSRVRDTSYKRRVYMKERDL